MASYLYVIILLYVIFSINYCKNKLNETYSFQLKPDTLTRRAYPPIEPVKRRSKFINFQTKTPLVRQRVNKNKFLSGSVGSY